MGQGWVGLGLETHTVGVYAGVALVRTMAMFKSKIPVLDSACCFFRHIMALLETFTCHCVLVEAGPLVFCF